MRSTTIQMEDEDIGWALKQGRGWLTNFLRNKLHEEREKTNSSDAVLKQQEERINELLKEKNEIENRVKEIDVEIRTVKREMNELKENMRRMIESKKLEEAEAFMRSHPGG